MKKDIHDYVEKCYMCQVSKIEQVIKNLGLLQPLGVPNNKWESIGWMHEWMSQYKQKMHSLWIHTKNSKMIQMDMVVTLKNVDILIFE